MYIRYLVEFVLNMHAKEVEAIVRLNSSNVALLFMRHHWNLMQNKYIISQISVPEA